MKLNLAMAKFSSKITGIVSHRTGSLMSYWVLTQNGYVISHTSVQRVTNLETELLENKETFSEFDEKIKGIIREDDTFDFFIKI